MDNGVAHKWTRRGEANVGSASKDAESASQPVGQTAAAGRPVTRYGLAAEAGRAAAPDGRPRSEKKRHNQGTKTHIALQQKIPAALLATGDMRSQLN
jgi:hypothetical protein